jgi:hypothetical protein
LFDRDLRPIQFLGQIGDGWRAAAAISRAFQAGGNTCCCQVRRRAGGMLTTMQRLMAPRFSLRGAGGGVRKNHDGKTREPDC